jgi:secreted PhoX family phosphatase
MEPTSLPTEAHEPAISGRLTGTRRNFIRGVAAAGASTAVASALGRAGSLDLFAQTAEAAELTAFSNFTAIAASSADAFEVPPGFRADLVIGYGEKFADDRGNTYTYGYNNDFLAFFPLGDGRTEGILFVNHEYTNAFYLHGYKANDPGGKSRAEIDLERSTIGNSILHVRRNAEGLWKPVSPSKYNRRIYAGLMPGQPGHEHSVFRVTGPLAGDPKVGPENNGSLGNCSGGTTPWGTAISCEENFDGYGLPLPSTQDFIMGWADPSNDGFPGYPEYHPDRPYRNSDGFRKYGWVCEHDPYDPTFVPRKHTALGRFRHENTAFRHVPGKKFVIYMGDDQNNDCVYKFVSAREYRPGDRAHNLQILEAGQLYVARWLPEGRRRFNAQGDPQPVTQEHGTGTWVPIPVEGLSDTRNYLEAVPANRESTTTDYGRHYATNRPEDLEVGPDGEVYIALSNNTTRANTSTGDPGVNDAYGAVRKIVEEKNDPTALEFVWTEYAGGGPVSAGGTGFDSPDNLVFDSQDNLWVMTDISTGSIGRTIHAFHANNAVFMVPTKGPNAGVAFRFANMPIQAEGTGPYFTPDESTLFVNVQHPGELAGTPEGPDNRAVFGNPSTYPSYWPRGNKTTGANPSEPLPSTVAIQRVAATAGPGSPVIPPATSRPDKTLPRIRLLSPRRQSLGRFRTEGMRFRIGVDEAVTLRVTVYGRLTSRRRRASGSLAQAAARGKVRQFGRVSTRVDRAGVVTVTVRPRASMRLLLRREAKVPATLSVRATDAAGNASTRTKLLLFK